MPQQTFWRHDGQRLAKWPHDLAAQQMIILRGRAWVGDLNIVFGGHGEKTFRARAGMFRALAFETMRQEKNEAAETLPFIFGAGDELVDDDLRDVPEIAEL